MEDMELTSIESTGKSVDEAIFKGLQQMGISIDEVSIEIVRTESKGFLGIGSKPAIVKLTKKPPEEFDISDFSAKKEEKRDRRDRKPRREENRPEEKPVQDKAERKPKPKKNGEDISREINKDKPRREPAPDKEQSEKPAKPAKEAARRPEKKDEPKPEQPKANPEEANAEAPAEPEKPIVYTLEAAEGNPAAEFVKGLIERMGAEGQVLAAMDGDCLRLRIDSEMMGMLIGHRGETLDAMQYLTGLVVNKNRKTEGYTRVTLNTEEYREKREETLRKLAKKVAAQVKASGKPRVLEPMNPYERRVLHATLQSNPDVTTHSEGEEPNRRVVVTPKRRGRSGYSKSRGNRRSAPRRDTAPADDGDNGTISREEYEKLYEAARAANPMFMGKPKEE